MQSLAIVFYRYVIVQSVFSCARKAPHIGITIPVHSYCNRVHLIVATFIVVHWYLDTVMPSFFSNDQFVRDIRLMESQNIVDKHLAAARGGVYYPKEDYSGKRNYQGSPALPTVTISTCL